MPKPGDPMRQSSKPTLSQEEWKKRLAEKRAETAIPGYWETIASNCAQWAKDLSVGGFWAEATKSLDQWRTEYRQQNGTNLLISPGLPLFCGKEADRIKGKPFRRCRDRADYLDKAIPVAGAPIPRIGDLVRTRIVCGYIDGVEFLTSKLHDLADEMKLKPQRRREGRIEGYFAQHLAIDADVIFRFAGASELTKIVCEVQVASELATRMWDAAHPVYEFSREEEDRPEAWQWDPTDPRFIANQLGHMIHLADGLLVQLRLQQESRKT